MPTRAELTDQKLRVVRGLINEQVRISEIKRVFALKFKCTPRAAERFITAAYKELREESGQTTEQHRDNAYAFWQARAANQNLPERERMRARENLDKITGVHAAVKVAPTDTAGKDLPPPKAPMSMRELDNALDKFMNEFGLGAEQGAG